MPEASVVNEFNNVGFGEVLQQIPLAVTGELPWEVTVPPEFADVFVMFEIAVVDTVGDY